MNRPLPQRRLVLGSLAAAGLALSGLPARAQADKPLRLGFSMARTGMPSF